MDASQTERSWCVWNLRDVAILWLFNTLSGGNSDVMVTNGIANIPL
jgi:hypothetical protein